MKYLFTFICFVALQNLVFGQYRSKYQQKLLKQRTPFFQKKHQETEEYTVHYFTQEIDHLSFNNSTTFQQKYLVRNKYYKVGGPILFYAGNEGPIEMFYENTGFLNDDLAEKFGAMVVYMEHRYYGDSMPFENEKISYSKQNLIYLTSLQALYDYSVFLEWYKVQLGDQYKPTVAFGGSYGGMLASWMRMKFPNIIDGALGASAPIVYFMNREDLDLESFYQIATVNYEHKSCNYTIREGFNKLDTFYKDGNYQDFQMLSQSFNLCDPITKKSEVTNLINWIDEAYSYMAMTNYPYETGFLKKLPAWPANTSCIALENINSDSSDTQLFTAIKESVETYYNYDGTEKCNQIFDDQATFDNDMSGWEIQACGDMVMPMSSNGETDMFPPYAWNSKQYNEQCYEQWGLYPNYDWALNFYGGRTDEEYSAYSNIFLSNGMLDPWAGGGVYYTNEDLDFNHFLMSECAHHLDLRSPNPADPESVKKGRQLEIEAIGRWISQKEQINQKSKLNQFQEQVEL